MLASVLPLQQQVQAFARWLAFACLLLLVSACRPQGSGSGLAPGQAPPAIELPSLDGAQVSLSSFHGKVVLLNFWASWCAPCVAEMPELQRVHEELSPSGFSVVAVGVEDSPENLNKVRQRYGLTFPILVDRQGVAKRAYRLAGFPETFVLNSDGKLTMVLDPDTSEPVIRFIGPREWARDPAIGILRALLN